MQGGTGGWRVEVTGLRQVLDALDKMDTGATKIIVKRIKDKGNEVRKSAQARTPGRALRNWGEWFPSRRAYKNDDKRDLSFDNARVTRGFTVRKNNYRRRGVSAGAGWDVWQRDPAGAVFEVMGDFSRVSDEAGRHMVEAVNRKFPTKVGPRTLVPAYYDAMTPDFKESVRKQIIAEAKKAGLV